MTAGRFDELIEELRTLVRAGDLTEQQRHELIDVALDDEDGPVTRWVVAYEQATPLGPYLPSYRDSGDPPHVALGLAVWLQHALIEASDEERPTVEEDDEP